MQRKISIPALLLSVVTAAVIAFMLAFVLFDARLNDAAKQIEASYRAQYDEYHKFDKLLELDNIVKEYYVGEIDDEKLMDMILTGYMVGTGDKYADYFTAEQIDEFMSDLQGELYGIGVNVIYNAEEDAIEIVNVMPDSPAISFGLLPGDLVIAVGNGESAETVAYLGYDVAISKIRGPEGTNAEFVILRDGEYIDCSITRAKVVEQTVLPRVYQPDNTVGVIKVTGFDKKTPEQFEAAVDELKALGCTSLVVDVRNNPGGELTAICAVLDYLLPEGPIVRTIDREGNEETIAISGASHLGMPMSVIVNRSTASAAELFASALKDYKAATVVGTLTYGKGSMQNVAYLSDGSGYKFTYRLYCPPFSDNYEGVGVEPDITVELDPALEKINPYKYKDEEDNQLTAAVAALNK